MSTLLVIYPGRNVMKDCDFTILVAETGEALASHICSCSCFAYGDLYANRKERIREWTERFGELEVKYIDETDITEEKLIARNKKWYEENKDKETP
jgi:hypothetical protein